MRSRSRMLAVALLATSLLALGACSGDTDEPAPAAATGSDTASDSPSSDPSSDPSSAPASPTPPSVTPAVGTSYQRQGVSFTLPDDFMSLGDVGNGLLRSADYAAAPLTCVLSVTEVGGADLAGYDLDDVAQMALTSAGPTVTRLPDREVGGQEVYVLSGKASGSALSYQVGRIADGRNVSFSFGFQNDRPDSQAIIDSILATVVWKS